MGLSRLPSPLYFLLTFGLACYMFYNAVARFKKDRKSLIVLYVFIGLGCFMISLLTINDLYFHFTGSILFIITVLIFICIIITLCFLIYAGWTNKKNPKAKKLILIALSFFVFAALLSIIGYIML